MILPTLSFVSAEADNRSTRGLSAPAAFPFLQSPESTEVGPGFWRCGNQEDSMLSMQKIVPNLYHPLIRALAADTKAPASVVGLAPAGRLLE